MIRRVWRGTVRFLSSARLATWLLAIVGLWSLMATLVAQGEPSARTVAAWAASHPAVEPLVATLGLHQAFSSVVFIACILLLVVSTGLCAWQRTKVSIGRTRTLRRAAAADERSLSESHDLEVGCDPALSASEVLSIATATLDHLGIRTKRRNDLVTAVSPPWSVWGSPVFHWALFALMVTLLVGNLQRSEGLMGVAVGETKADVKESYGTGHVHAGPLHDWSAVHRSIRVDGFEPDFQTGGIDRGPTPLVSVLDGAGQVVVTQRVYPNNTLHAGSLTIYPADWGLAASVSLVNTSGVEVARAVQLVDFSAAATGGTVPAAPLFATHAQVMVSVSVPLDGTQGNFSDAMPQEPTARRLVATLDGKSLVDRTVSPGEAVALPDGDSLRLNGIGYYARLQVVDDWSIPFLYVGLVVAMIGLTVAVAVRQQIVLVAVLEEPEGVRLAATVRLWRNSSSTRGEIESELTRALGGVQEGSTT